MSNSVFPTWLPGLMFTQAKRPVWATDIQTALSGKESRQARISSPLYQWTLQYEFLFDSLSRTNYIPYSSDFTQANWTSNGGGAGFAPVVVPNYTTAPDGTLTADRAILNAGPNNLGTDFSQLYQSGIAATAGLAITSSIWAKTNDGSTVKLRFFANGGVTGADVSITPQWQRFVISQSAATTGSAGAYCGFRCGFFAGNSAYADISVWGGQIEAGAQATPLIPTFGAASTVSDLKTLLGFHNLMQGSWDTFLYQDPAFNTVSLQQYGVGTGSQTQWQLTATYSGDGLNNGFPEIIQNTNGAPILYENRYGAPERLSTASRKNLALQSNFAATWGATNVTVTAAAATAPDGTTTAASVVDTVTNAAHAVTQGSIAITGGGRYTFSVWLKYSNHQFVGVILDDGGSNGMSVVVDLVNGVIGSVLGLGTFYSSNADATITAANNGWYRVSISGQLPTVAVTCRLDLQFCQNLTTIPWSAIYAGSGTDKFFAWGAQLEAGTFATALIPTTTAAVTVGADYSIGATGFVTFNAAPASQTVLLWSGSFYYRCRFTKDEMEVGSFLSNFWEAKKVDFQQVKL